MDRALTSGSTIDDTDRVHLERCVELARQAVRAGHRPFGSVLVAADGTTLREDHNRTGDGDPTAHPEIALARWAALNLSEEERRESTLYTSGEHCPMCATAHAWCGLGRIVFATSTGQLVEWLADLGRAPLPYKPLTLREILPDHPVAGPDPTFADAVRALHADVGRKG